LGAEQVTHVDRKVAPALGVLGDDAGGLRFGTRRLVRRLVAERVGLGVFLVALGVLAIRLRLRSKRIFLRAFRRLLTLCRLLVATVEGATVGGLSLRGLTALA